jgi:glutathione peroxidase-family protein
MSAFHEFSLPSITGETVRFEDYRGRYCLVVNVASR